MKTKVVVEVLPEQKVKRSRKTTLIKKDTKLSNKFTSEVDKVLPKRRSRLKSVKSD